MLMSGVPTQFMLSRGSAADSVYNVLERQVRPSLPRCYRAAIVLDMHGSYCDRPRGTVSIQRRLRRMQRARYMTHVSVLISLRDMERIRIVYRRAAYTIQSPLSAHPEAAGR